MIMKVLVVFRSGIKNSYKPVKSFQFVKEHRKLLITMENYGRTVSLDTNQIVDIQVDFEHQIGGMPYSNHN